MDRYLVGLSPFTNASPEKNESPPRRHPPLAARALHTPRGKFLVAADKTSHVNIFCLRRCRFPSPFVLCFRPLRLTGSNSCHQLGSHAKGLRDHVHEQERDGGCGELSREGWQR